jgi:hypothetical protein
MELLIRSVYFLNNLNNLNNLTKIALLSVEFFLY